MIVPSEPIEIGHEAVEIPILDDYWHYCEIEQVELTTLDSKFVTF